MSDPARLTIVTGFLGAGKSTWLRHHLHSGVFDGAHIVVNEAAATPVDRELLGDAPLLSVLSGGCACCERRAELIALLRVLCAASGTRPRHIVLETSGLADPQAIVDAVRTDPDLEVSLVVSEVVTLVGASRGLGLLRREPLAHRQAASADCLIVTKLDESSQAEAARLVAALGLLNPGAPLFGACRGVETPLPTPSAEAAAGVLDLAPDAARTPLQAVDVSLEGIEWSCLSLWLSALLHARGSDILRVKGIVVTPAGRLLLQGVAGALAEPAMLPGQPQAGDGTLVVIGRGFAPADLRRSLVGFARACRP